MPTIHVTLLDIAGEQWADLGTGHWPQKIALACVTIHGGITHTGNDNRVLYYNERCLPNSKWDYSYGELVERTAAAIWVAANNFERTRAAISIAANN